MRRGIARRFSQPVALIEASVFGVAGVVVALLGPWPLLALAAGPLIAAVVLVIATWPKRLPKAKPERDVPALVRHWADLLAADDPARAQADEAARLMDAIDELALHCRLGIAHLDGSARTAANERLRAATGYATKSVDAYAETNTAPSRAQEWSALVKRFQAAHTALQAELKSLS